MTVLPLVVTTSLPSMVIFTGSIGEDCGDGVLENWSIALHPSLHYSNTTLLHVLVSYRASLLGDVRFEFVAKLADKCARRPGSGVAERANRVARDVAGDVENQIQITFFAVTILNAVKDFLHPVAALAAWAALPA